MYIYDSKNKKTLGLLTLYLTEDEAKELRDDLEDLLKNISQGNHAHVSSADYQKEVTVCIYSDENIGQFDDEFIRIIENEMPPGKTN